MSGRRFFGRPLPAYRSDLHPAQADHVGQPWAYVERVLVDGLEVWHCPDRHEAAGDTPDASCAGCAELFCELLEYATPADHARIRQHAAALARHSADGAQRMARIDAWSPQAIELAERLGLNATLAARREERQRIEAWIETGVQRLLPPRRHPGHVG